MEKKGLYDKYDIYKRGKCTPLTNCFVLRPEKDKHAVAALYVYASLIQRENTELADDIRTWLGEMEISNE